MQASGTDVVIVVNPWCFPDVAVVYTTVVWMRQIGTGNMPSVCMPSFVT